MRCCIFVEFMVLSTTGIVGRKDLLLRLKHKGETSYGRADPNRFVKKLFVK